MADEEKIPFMEDEEFKKFLRETVLTGTAFEATQDLDPNITIRVHFCQALYTCYVMQKIHGHPTDQEIQKVFDEVKEFAEEVATGTYRKLPKA